MALSSSEILGYFYRALGCKIGLLIKTDEPEKLRQRFYAARKTDPALATVAIRIDPAGDAICLTPEKTDASPASP